MKQHLCRRLRLFFHLWVSTVLLSSALHAQGGELRVAAAADLQPVFSALVSAYGQAAGVTLVPSFGSSATLTQQLLNGAPHDVFLSADYAHPQQLAAAGRTDGDPVPYARGVLVLWARRDSPAQPLQPTSKEAHALDALLRPSVSRVALANPEHAPYGQAAMAALYALHLYDAVSPKIVLGENVSQSAQFALSGNAQAAFISLTSANSPPFRAAGSFVEVPAMYPELLQCGVALKQSPHLREAKAFLQWLTSDATQRRLTELGFHPVR